MILVISSPPVLSMIWKLTVPLLFCPIAFSGMTKVGAGLPSIVICGAVEMESVQPLAILTISPEVLSTTQSFHVPLGFMPSNTAMRSKKGGTGGVPFVGSGVLPPL